VTRALSSPHFHIAPAILILLIRASCSSTDHGGGKRRAITQRPVPLVTFRDLNVHEIGKG
jgi:hypothetical protein